MPGVERLSVDLVAGAVEEAAQLGIPAVAVFPATDPGKKNEEATEAVNPDNLVCRSVRAIKTACPHIGIVCDVALDPYTSHGHDGLLDGTEVVNDATVDVLVRNYRVSRLQLQLEPNAPLVVFWEEAREWLVFIDGVFQPGGNAPDIAPGLHNFEVRRGNQTNRYLRAVPERGVYRLDLTTGELIEVTGL